MGEVVELGPKQVVRAETERPHALRQAITCCRNGGTVSIIGVYGGMADKFPIGSLMNRSLTGPVWPVPRAALHPAPARAGWPSRVRVVGSGMRPVLRFSGVAAVAVLWTTIGAGMLRTGLRFTDERPISYLGTDPRGIALFRSGLLVATVLLVAFAWAVRDRFSAPASFLAAFLVGQAGQVVAALVPISGPGSSHGVHTAGGIILGLSLPVLIWRFAAGLPPGRWRARAYALCWLEVAAVLVGIALSRAMRAPLAEIVPAAGFHLWIGVVTARFRNTGRG